MFRIEIEGRTDIGLVRNENEDALCWSRGRANSFSYMAVADGMGGYYGGATASETAVKAITQRLSILQDAFPSYTPCQQTLILKSEIYQAIQDANRAILEKKHQNLKLQQMGTTIVAAIIWENSLIIAHIGDSRAYYWNSRTGLTQLTKDHSVVQGMIDTGTLTEEKARTCKIRNQLTRALGVSHCAEPEINQFQLTDSCLLMLCSDGVTEYFSHTDIEQTLATNSSTFQSCYAFIEESNRLGGKDNISVIIAECSKSATEDQTDNRHRVDSTVPYRIPEKN